jgi:cytosine deaminase
LAGRGAAGQAREADSSFFGKKEAKKIFDTRSFLSTRTVPIDKSFLVLFFKKEPAVFLLTQGAEIPIQLTNGRGADGAAIDITIVDGRIAAITPYDPTAMGTDLGGRLVLPALVDGHVHLDKTVMGLPWRANSGAPTVQGRIENERSVRHTLSQPVERRGTTLLRRMIAHGTTALRTHVDIDDDVGLDNFHAVLRLIEPFRAMVDIQVVAFPQSGILARPRVADLLDAALREGADLVGGLDPATIDGDAKGHLDVVFGLAGKHGKGIDIHLHDGGPGGNEQLRDIAARSLAAGMARRVVVSHAFSLGTTDADDFAATADALAEGGVAILTSSPSPTPVPPVKALRARGVRIFAGSDNIRDLWSPFGNGDMVERAMLISLRQGFRADADIALAYDLCSGEAALGLGLPARTLAIGAPADLIALDSETLGEAVAERPPGRWVYHAGKKISPN